MKRVSVIIGFLGIVLNSIGLGWAQQSMDISSFYAKSWAVVIGINTYAEFPSLEYAVNDAKAVVPRLKSMGFEVIVLLDEQATKQNIMDVLTQQLPAKVGKDDRVVIFYAGHGAAGMLPTGEELGFLIPTDAHAMLDGRKLDIIGGDRIAVAAHASFIEKTNFISVDDIRNISDSIPAKHILYILDGCYSGFLDPAVYSRSQTSKRSGRDVKVAQQTETSRSLIIDDETAPVESKPSVVESKPSVIDESPFGRLKVMTTRETVQILTAGSSGEQVYEKSGHGVFTYYLLKALDGAADIPDDPNAKTGDCIITATEIGNYVKQKVPAASENSQSPLFNRVRGEGEFIFIPRICQEPDPVDEQPPVADQTWTKTDAYKGPKNAAYKSPVQVLVDQDDQLYVLDTGLQRILKFDAQGNYLPITYTTNAIEKSWSPTSMAIGYGGELWVYYSWQGKPNKKEAAPPGKLVRYAGDGTLAADRSGKTEPMTACVQRGEELLFPSYGLIALDIEDNLIVVDQEQGVMMKCDRNGKLLKRWGEETTLGKVNRVTNPMGLAVDLFGYIYVSDTRGNGIQKYYDGQWIGGWPNVKGKKPHFFDSPHGLAVDSNLYVYVADTQNHRIKKYTSVNQKLLTYWGKQDAKKGNKYGEFDTPTAVAVNWDSTKIYVADTGNKRVQKFVIER